MPKIFLSLFVLLLAAAPAFGQGWRGLVPLQSTAADVEHTLGPPNRADSPTRLVYELEDELAFIYLSTGTCERGGPDALNVPANVVVKILVAPLKKSLLSAASGGRVASPPDRKEVAEGIKDHVLYYFEDDSRIVETFKGDIRSITYQPAREGNRHLRCYASLKEYYEAQPPGCWGRLDEYGNIRFEDEQARLDNFAIALLNEPGTHGYITGYGGRRGRAGEALRRVERAKNYLVKERDIDPRRIIVIDGGHREELTVELNIIPLGAFGPYPTPTVDPSEVEIIPERPKARRRKD